ncbi:hypothetical protein SCALM49S_08229 [Streptomyces californicus]
MLESSASPWRTAPSLSATRLGQAVQQLLQIVEVAVGEQPQLVVARDPRGVVERRLEQPGRRPPGVHPADRAQRGTDVGPRRRLRRMPGEGGDPAGHPLDHQRAVLRVRRDQPGARTGGGAGRTRGTPLSRAGTARSTPASGPVNTSPRRWPARSCRRSGRSWPLRRSTWTGLNSGQTRCTEAIAIRTCAPCGPDRSILPLSGPASGPGARLGPGPYLRRCAGVRSQIGPGARAHRAERSGRGGHGGRCCVHGRDRSLRAPTRYVRQPGRRPALTLGSTEGCRAGWRTPT